MAYKSRSELHSPFPSGVHFFASSLPEPPLALPEEEAATSAISSTSRLKEFRLGRHCARRALQQFHVNSPVFRNPDTREPLWPDGVVGSITHSGKWAAAVAAPTSEIAAIGIDMEQIPRSINPGIARLVCTEKEKAWLASLDATQADLGLKAVFSAKESIYKCLFPRCRIPLTFQDATITLRDDWQSFRFQLHRPCPPFLPEPEHEGVLTFNHEILLSGVFINSVKSAR